MKAPLGAVVSIYYDSPRHVEEGQALVTVTGRAYLILELRQQERGRHIGRWYIHALVSEIHKLPIGTVCHPIYWYRRKRHSVGAKP